MGVTHVTSSLYDVGTGYFMHENGIAGMGYNHGDIQVCRKSRGLARLYQARTNDCNHDWSLYEVAFWRSSCRSISLPCGAYLCYTSRWSNLCRTQDGKLIVADEQDWDTLEITDVKQMISHTS